MTGFEKITPFVIKGYLYGGLAFTNKLKNLAKNQNTSN
jgi:hypothetical protein